MSGSNVSNEAHPFTPDETTTAADIPILLRHIPFMDPPAHTIPPQYFVPIQGFEGLFPFSLSDPRETSSADIPILSRPIPSRSSTRPTRMHEAPKSFHCDICGRQFAQRQGLKRHIRDKHDPRSCMFCDFKWSRLYVYRDHLQRHHATRMSCLYCDFDFDFEWSRRDPYRDHLEKHHPDVDPAVALDPANHIRRLCMYCDVLWFHSGQSYKNHLKEHHPNLDPDAVLGEVPGSQRRDKIICKIQYIKARVSTQDHKIGRTSALFTREFWDEVREVMGGNSLAGT